jgi:hypothetical protein
MAGSAACHPISASTHRPHHREMASPQLTG